MAIVAELSEMDCHVRIVLGVIDVVGGFVIVAVVVVAVVVVVVVVVDGDVFVVVGVYGGNVIKFVRAWVESAIVAESSKLDCHVRIVLGVIDVVIGFVVVVVVFVVDVVVQFV